MKASVTVLVRMSKAWAAVQGRDYVIPDDLQLLLARVFAHRILLTPDAHVAGRTAEHVLGRVVAAVPIPGEPRPGQPREVYARGGRQDMPTGRVR